MRFSSWISDVCSSDRTRLLFLSRHTVMRCGGTRCDLFKNTLDSGHLGLKRHPLRLWKPLLAQQQPCLISTALPCRAMPFGDAGIGAADRRSEEHTSELQSLMRISYAVFCLKKKKNAQP